jgi:hypothetical protein
MGQQSIQTNLIDNLELFATQYKQHSDSRIEKAQEVWDSLHIDRTNMLWSKEEYVNAMRTYKGVKHMIELMEKRYNQAKAGE